MRKRPANDITKTSANNPPSVSFRPLVSARKSLLAALALLTSSFAFTPPEAQEFTHNICDIDNQAFQAGEEIVYSVYYNWNFVWLPAGEVTFKVTDEYGQHHLSVKGRTYPSYEWFFKVRDQYDTYLDKETLLPNVSIRDVHEGGYRVYDKVTFDQKNGKAVSLRGRSVKEATPKDFWMKSCTHDMLSMIYHIRNVNYELMTKGQEIPARIFLDREVYPLKVRYGGKEQKQIHGLGHFNTIRVSPQLISGSVFKEGTEMKVWATDDYNRIPLLIESPVSVGSVKVVLKSYKGLRHPFTSKIAK